MWWCQSECPVVLRCAWIFGGLKIGWLGGERQHSIEGERERERVKGRKEISSQRWHTNSLKVQVIKQRPQRKKPQCHLLCTKRLPDQPRKLQQPFRLSILIQHLKNAKYNCANVIYTYICFRFTHIHLEKYHPRHFAFTSIHAQ